MKATNIVRGGAKTMAAVIKEDEAEMDPNIELLQASVERMATGVSELRGEVRDLRARQETDSRERHREMIDLRDKIDAKIDPLYGRIDAKVDPVRDRLADLDARLERTLRKMTIGWFLSLGAILGVMAKGFHWI